MTSTLSKQAIAAQAPSLARHSGVKLGMVGAETAFYTHPGSLSVFNKKISSAHDRGGKRQSRHGSTHHVMPPLSAHPCRACRKANQQVCPAPTWTSRCAVASLVSRSAPLCAAHSSPRTRCAAKAASKPCTGSRRWKSQPVEPSPQGPHVIPMPAFEDELTEFGQPVRAPTQLAARHKSPPRAARSATGVQWDARSPAGRHAHP
jgi:hypothetical protein